MGGQSWEPIYRDGSLLSPVGNVSCGSIATPPPKKTGVAAGDRLLWTENR